MEPQLQQPITPVVSPPTKHIHHLWSFLVLGFFALLSLSLVAFIIVLPKQTSELKVITNKPTPTPIIDTSNWKTYTNTGEGITFQYPNSWDVNNNGNSSIELTLNKIPRIEFLITENPNNLTLKQIDEENTVKDKQRGTISTPRLESKNFVNVTLGNQPALYEKEYFCEPAICQRYVIIGNKKVLEVIIFSNPPDQRPTIDQILSTLKFIQ